MIWYREFQISVHIIWFIIVFFTYTMFHNLICHINDISYTYLSLKLFYLMFLWQVEFWLAKNLLLTLHGSRAVYFIRHRKSIIALTYCLCCVFHTAQKINNSSLWPISKDTRIYVFPIKIYVIYPVLKGSGFAKRFDWRLTV